MRILIRKAQLIFAQYEKALIPVYCHASGHYYRAYLQEGGSVETILKQHQYVHYCFRCCKRAVSSANISENCCGTKKKVTGPFFVGQLWDKELAGKIVTEAGKIDPAAGKLAYTIAQESHIQTVGTYSLPRLGSKLKKQVPKMELAVNELNGAKTHFAEQSIRTKADIALIKKLF